MQEFLCKIYVKSREIGLFLTQSQENLHKKKRGLIATITQLKPAQEEKIFVFRSIFEFFLLFRLQNYNIFFKYARFFLTFC